MSNRTPPDAHVTAASRALTTGVLVCLALGGAAAVLRWVGAPTGACTLLVLLAAACAGWAWWWLAPQTTPAPHTWTPGVATSTPVAGGVLARVVVAPTGMSGSGQGTVVLVTTRSALGWKAVPCRTSATGGGRVAVDTPEVTVLGLLPARHPGRAKLGKGTIPDRPR